MSKTMDNSLVESKEIYEEESKKLNRNSIELSESPEMKEDKKDVKKTKREEKGNSVAFHKLFCYADSIDVILMIVGTMAATVNGLVTPFSALFFGELIDSFGGNQSTQHIVQVISKVCLKFVYLAIITFVAAFCQVSSWVVTGERQASRIKNLYLKFTLKQDITYFDKETTTGEVVGRISGNLVLIQDAMGEEVGKCIQLVTAFFGSFIVAFMKGSLLTAVLLSSIPLIVGAIGILGIVLHKLSNQGLSSTTKAADLVEQTINSIRTVASFTGENQAVRNYDKLLRQTCKSGVLESVASGFGIGIIKLFIFCSYSLAVWFGSKMILNKGYSGGDIMIVLTTVVIGSTSLGHASSCMTAIAAGRAAAFKIFETFKRTPHIDAYDPKGRISNDISGNIEFKEIYFSYPTRPDEPILKGFSLQIPSGITLALVGQSGSGKSTVISLIERFYDPQIGEVLIDGINLKEFQLKWIRSKIGLVSQEPVLLTSSIKDNIAYGKDGATIEEIRAAAKLANASSFIDNLPQGLDTMVGNNGAQLSGGQRQRVAIARAILKDPRILLLDEATSALDAKSESIVQEALNRIMKNRTTVIVAHRLRTVRNADMIVVMHKGKIVEKGSHGALLKDPNGTYSELIQLQEVNKALEEVEIDQSRLQDSKESLAEETKATNSLEPRTSITYKSEPINNSPSTDTQLVPKSQIYRLILLNKAEIPTLLFGSIAAIMSGLVFPIFGLLIALVTKTFFEPHDKLERDSKFWALMFLILGVSSLLMSLAQSYFFAVAGSKLICRIQLMCFKKLVRMEVSWFDKPENSSGAIGAKLSTDATTLRSLVGSTLAQLVSNIAAIVAALTIAFGSSWELTLVILGLFPFLGVNNFVQVKFLERLRADSKMIKEEACQIVSDAVGSIRTIASFCAEDKVIQQYKNKTEGPTKIGIRQGLISGIGFGLSLSSMSMVYALNFYAGARLVADGKVTFSNVFNVFFAVTITAMVIAPSSSAALDFVRAKEVAASIFAIIDRRSKIDPSNESGMAMADVKGEIEFHHVCFSYPSRPDVEIFKDLSLTIHHGKTIALVGESGCGKSTIISLLQRFYDPSSGHITFDGIRIQELQVKWLRQQMGLVSQEPILFNDTIRANIAYGNDGNATEAEILAASELANAHMFISGLQQGYDTIVGERGVQLSGGQKQRVAIARAIVKSPKILLLDEATSALDAESEKVVQDAIDKVVINRTTIIVAHRLSTIRNAHTILVFKNGVIVEKGNHEALVSIKDGFYASLIALNANSSPV